MKNSLPWQALPVAAGILAGCAHPIQVLAQNTPAGQPPGAGATLRQRSRLWQRQHRQRDRGGGGCSRHCPHGAGVAPRPDDHEGIQRSA